MSNILRFEIRTDAPYTEDEQVELLDNFLAFMNEIDSDVVDASEKLDVVDEKDDASGEISDAKKQEIVEEFLSDENHGIEVQLKVRVKGVNNDGEIASYMGPLEVSFK